MPRRSATTQLQLPIQGTQSIPLDVSTLRPGFLVGLKTSVRGNVSHLKQVIEPEHKTRSGEQKSKWQTERTVKDPEEYRKASQIRMKARMTVVNVCACSEFGLLCPEADAQKLALAIKEARRLCDVFNRTARQTRVTVYVISGRIARDDVEAARAIKSEMRALINEMAEGVRNCDAEAVRKAASRAKSVGAMLAPEAAGAIKGAIEIARGAARKITKAGEEAAQQIDQEAIRSLSQARTAFLDVSEGEDSGEAELPTPEARAVDVEPSPEEAAGLISAETAQQELRQLRKVPAKAKFTGKRKVAKKSVARRRGAVEASA